MQKQEEKMNEGSVSIYVCLCIWNKKNILRELYIAGDRDEEFNLSTTLRENVLLTADNFPWDMKCTNGLWKKKKKKVLEFLLNLWSEKFGCPGRFVKSYFIWWSKEILFLCYISLYFFLSSSLWTNKILYTCYVFMKV